MPVLGPAVMIAFGIVWTFRSLLEVVAHPDFWDPVTLIDHLAVWSYSLGFALLAGAVLALVRQAGGGRAAWLAAAGTASMALLAAGANVVEDALDVDRASTAYVVGALGTVVGLLSLTVALAVRRWRHAAVAGLWLIGVPMVTSGFGFLALVGSLYAVYGSRAGTATGLDDAPTPQG